MMDPFFTSKVKDDFHEKRQRSRAYAKAFQLRRFTSKLPLAKCEAAIKSAIREPNSAARAARIFKVSDHQVSGAPALNGFKQPKHIWTEHRNSGNPNFAAQKAATVRRKLKKGS